MTIKGLSYEAVGIGLISDVLASAVSAYIYKKSDCSKRLSSAFLSVLSADLSVQLA